MNKCKSISAFELRLKPRWMPIYADDSLLSCKPRQSFIRKLIRHCLKTHLWSREIQGKYITQANWTSFHYDKKITFSFMRWEWHEAFEMKTVLIQTWDIMLLIRGYSKREEVREMEIKLLILCFSDHVYDDYVAQSRDDSEHHDHLFLFACMKWQDSMWGNNSKILEGNCWATRVKKEEFHFDLENSIFFLVLSDVSNHEKCESRVHHCVTNNRAKFLSKYS